MRFRSLFLAVTVAFGLYGQEPIRLSVSEWDWVNPLLQTQDTDTEVLDLVFDRLVTLDDKGNFVPELLESWTVLKGGREVVLKLRPDLTWQDGSPIEAEDLVFTWRSHRLPSVRQVADSGGIASLDSLIAEDSRTVRIRLAKPRGTLLFDLYTFIPVPRRHYAMGAKPREAPVNFHPVGSGPYRVVGDMTTKFMRLERWDGYRGIHPGTWPTFELRDARSEKDVVGALVSGRTHYAQVNAREGALRHILVRLGARGDGKLQTFAVPQSSFNAFFLNCDPKLSLLGDVRLRQALAELVPWDELSRGQRFIQSRLATTFWPPESWAHDPTPHPLPSLERARSLLDEAGWRSGTDGLRRDSRGRPLVLEAYVEVTAPNRSAARLLADQATAVGVRITVKRVPSTELFRLAAEHQGDLWNFGWAMDLDPDMDAQLFTREGLKTQANMSAYDNPDMDRLFSEARHTMDRNQRKQVYVKIANLIRRDRPVIPLTYDINRVICVKRLQGVRFSELGRSYGFWPGRRGWHLVN